VADVETRLRELSERAKELERKRAKKEADLDQAKAQMGEIVKRLKEVYEVESIDEAKVLLEQANAELDKTLADLAEALN
jgi:hypothetical protein